MLSGQLVILGVLEDETSQIISCAFLKFWGPRRVHPRVSICPDLLSQAQILSWFASLYITGAALISTTEGSAPGFLVGRDLNCKGSGRGGAGRSRSPGDVTEGVSTEASIDSVQSRGWLADWGRLLSRSLSALFPHGNACWIWH